jgi:curved DNA-binding protein
MARDYYEVLGVPRGADQDTLQSAYRTLARKHHPDVAKDPGAEERFKEINEAYHVLSDPKTRARYDRWGPDFRQYPEEAEAGWARGGPSAGSGTGRQSAGWGARRQGYGRGTPGDIDVEDLFSAIFGGRAAGPVPGADQEAELVLTVEEAYTGGRRRISLGDRELEVTIPPGVIDGQRIRLAGEGGPGGRGGQRGDLYLVVRLAPHPRYEVHGRDIYVPLEITPWEAVLGAKVPVDTPGGEVKVTVASGTSSGKRLRLKGQGLPHPRARPGDLYAEVLIMVPPKPTKAERELFEQLARVSTFDPRKR